MAYKPEYSLLKAYISFIDTNHVIKWSHLHFIDGEIRHKVDTSLHTGCFMEYLMEGKCQNCPVDSAFRLRTMQEIEFESNGRSWLVNTFPSYDAEGNFNGVFEIGSDISELQQLKLKAEDDEKRLEALTGNSMEAIFVISENRFNFINPAGIKLLDIDADQIDEYHPLDFLPAAQRSRIVSSYNEFLKNKLQNTAFEFEIQTNNGNIKWLSLSSVRISWKGKPALLGFAFDVTDRHKAVEALHASEEYYKILIDNQTDLVVKVDTKGYFLFASPSYLALFGLTKENLNNKTFMPLVHPDDKESTARAMKSLYEPPYTCCLEQRAFTVHGWRWIEWSDNAIVDDNGKVESIIGVGRDIHKRKLAELALTESQRRLSSLLGNLPGMAYRCRNDQQWTMEFVSEGCHQLTGYKPADLVANKKLSYNDIIHPDFQLEIWKKWQHCLNQRSRFTDEYIIITATGEKKWVWEQGQGVFDENGDVEALEGIILDINARKQSEIELVKSENRYRNLIQSSLVGIYTTSLTGQILYVNEALTRLLEYENIQQVKQVSTVSLIYKDPRDRERLISTLKTKGFIKAKELVWVTATGKEIVVVISAVLMGETISGMVMDITDRKRDEMLMVEAKNRAEQSDRLKSAFLANVSHEIRTPLNGIIGFAEMLADYKAGDDERKRISKDINKLSQQLLSTIDDILEISKIETNQVDVDSNKLNINSFIDFLVSKYSDLATEKNLEISAVKSLPDDQAVIETDEKLLSRIFNQLLSNAFKFTRSGFIRFGYKLVNEHLEFFVEDSGIGISEKHQKVIFEQFRQVEETLTREYRGLGIGLPITRSLVEKLGGQLRLNSVPNKGSSFIFALPFKSLPTPSLPPQNQANKSLLKGKKILICEDDDFGFIYLNRVLSNSGASVVRAVNGRSALGICKSDTQLDLIVMDMRMPEMSGAEAASRIKSLRPGVPIICCSAYSEDEIKRSSKTRCFDAIVQKPIVPNEILTLVTRLLDNQ